MARIKGVDVTLYEKTQTGEDAFGAPVWTETPVTVENVLIGQPETDDVTSAADLFGKRLSVWLGIPKDDAHKWEDVFVEWVDSYGETQRVRTFGTQVSGIAANMPRLPWNKKVRAERIEQGEV